MTIIASRDPYSEVVDERRRWRPDWFQWVSQLERAVYGPTLQIPTKVAIATVPIMSAVQAIQVAGYYSVGDGGAGLYIRTSSSAGPYAGVKSADGSFWRIARLPGISFFNYGAKGDGIADDAPAIRAAITDCPSGGEVVIPTPSVYFNIKSTITPTPRSTPITLSGLGASSKIKVDPTYSVGNPVFSINTSVFVPGWTFRNFSIDCNSLATGAIGLFGTGGVYNVNIENCFFSNPASGYSIFDDGLAVTSGTLAYSHISGCNFNGGVYLASVGDGLTVQNNIFTSNNNTYFGMYYNGVSGGAGFCFINNVVATPGVLLRVDRAVTPLITGNEFETPLGVTFGGSSCIQFGLAGGAGNLCRSPQFLNNGISVLPGTGDPIPVYIGNCQNTNIQGGRYLVSAVGGTFIFIDSAANGTFITTDNETEWVDGSGEVPAKISNLGTFTVYQTRGVQLRTAAAGSVALVNTVAKTVHSVTLSAGVWDISGYITFNGSGNTTLCGASLSTVANTLGADILFMPIDQVGGINNVFGSVAIPSQRFTLNTITTINLVAQSNFTGASMSTTSAVMQVQQAVMSQVS